MSTIDRYGRHLLLTVLPAVITAGVALLPSIAVPSRAQGPATVRAEARQDGRSLTVDIVADGVRNLAGFQMILSWDSSVVSLVGIRSGDFLWTCRGSICSVPTPSATSSPTGGAATSGDFLAKSGRTPYCPEPVTDVGALRMACVTFNARAKPGQPPLTSQVPGVQGTGTLAEARFRALRSGRVSLHLRHVILVDPLGGSLSSKTADLTLTVHGSGGSWNRGWLFGGIAGGVLAVAVLAGAAAVWRARRVRAAGGGPAAVPSDDDGTHGV